MPPLQPKQLQTPVQLASPQYNIPKEPIGGDHYGAAIRETLKSQSFLNPRGTPTSQMMDEGLMRQGGQMKLIKDQITNGRLSGRYTQDQLRQQYRDWVDRYSMNGTKELSPYAIAYFKDVEDYIEGRGEYDPSNINSPQNMAARAKEVQKPAGTSAPTGGGVGTHGFPGAYDEVMRAINTPQARPQASSSQARSFPDSASPVSRSQALANKKAPLRLERRGVPGLSFNSTPPRNLSFGN